MADLLKKAFSSDLQKNIFPDNQFYKQSKNDSAFVNHDSVQLPHVGTRPNVKMDRTDKGTATKRADSASEYKLREFSTDPTWLQYSEELLVNYNKRASILEEHRLSLVTNIAEYMAIAWSSIATSETVEFSGGARPTPAGTGDRKAFVLADIQKINTHLNTQDMPMEGRFALITPTMLEDMLKIPEVKSSDFNNSKPLVTGSIGMFMGITWYVRSKATTFTTGGTLRTFGSETTAVTDCEGGLAWHKDYVRRAEGSVKAFLNIDDAELYGSKMSAIVRAGAIAARKDGKGVVKFREVATA